MNINQHDKKYIDCRASKSYVTKFTNLDTLQHQCMFNSCVYDDILSALTVNQLLFENSSGDWELTQPDKILEVELDKCILFIFHTTLSEITVVGDEYTSVVDLKDSPGMIIISDEQVDGIGDLLPSTHGFIKIVNNDNYTPTLKLGEISIELE